MCITQRQSGEWEDEIKIQSFTLFVGFVWNFLKEDEDNAHSIVIWISFTENFQKLFSFSKTKKKSFHPSNT